MAAPHIYYRSDDVCGVDAEVAEEGRENQLPLSGSS